MDKSATKDVDIFSEISNYVFTSKYARYNEKLKRRETWEEAVKRVELMHLKRFSHLPEEEKKQIHASFDLVREKIVCPSMRSMQFGGKAIEAKNERIYNCSVRHVDSIRAFSEVFFLLLCGCGVGIGLHKNLSARIPDLVGAQDKTGTVITYVIEDTIEGWADSLEALLNCYCKNTALTGRKIVFDYSKIRKKGTKLKTGGGKAPGYKGLKNAHVKIKNLLDYIIENNGQTRLKHIDIYDILMHAADAVLSGGVRRSATIAIFQQDDEEMINSKTMLRIEKHGVPHKTEENKNEIWVNYKGQRHYITISDWEVESLKKNNQVDWTKLEPQRARSNNSVLLLRGKTTKEQFAEIIERTKMFGEPGFIWANDEYALFNPCGEIGFIPITKDGRCGVQFCNLTTLNGQKIKSLELLKEAITAQVIIGTLQASYTNFPYLTKASKELTEEESLLGVSMTGIMANRELLLNPQIQKEMAELAVNTNIRWAKILGINPAARVTCVKPEGTGTKALGSLASGIHPVHSEKQLLRIQANKDENVYKFFKMYNPDVCEESVWCQNKATDVITFPVQNPKGCLVKKDLTAIQHLEIIKSTQENWVLPGTTSTNKKDITHNVSCTVIVKDSEWVDVINFIFNNNNMFAAVSFLPDDGEKKYKQAPNETVSSPEEIVLFEKLVKDFHTVDYSKLEESDDETHLLEESSCAGNKCDLSFVQ
jgi:ribonucleoside-diphosphate reductase alpha chain